MSQSQANYIVSLSLLTLTLGFGLSCSTSQISPPRPSEPITDPIGIQDYPNVVIDPALEGLIVQAPPNVVRDPYSGTLGVTVPVRSITTGEILLEYRVLFLSPNGSEENPDTPWRAFNLAGRARRVLEAHSLKSDTTDWHMEIRPLR